MKRIGRVTSAFMRRTGLLLLALLLVPSAGSPQQGTPLGPEFRVNTYTTGRQGLATVASDSSGNFVVVWTSAQDPGYGVFGQRYSVLGTPSGPEFQINSYITGSQGGEDVASDPSGNFVVVWVSDQDPGNGIFGQRYSSAGTPLGGEFRVNTSATNLQVEPSVAADTAGNFVVVWRRMNQAGPANHVIFGQRYAGSGAPLGPEFRVNTYTTVPNYVSSPSVAMDAAGNFVVVWEGPDFGYVGGVFARRYASSGAPLGPEFKVNTEIPWGSSSGVSVATNAAGAFVVVWSSNYQGYYGGFADVRGRRFGRTGAPVGGEFNVASESEGYQVHPDVTMDSSGDFVVVWEKCPQGCAEGDVFGQRFDNSGTPSGGQFLVNTTTTGSQLGPAVASAPAGNFVVVWNGDQLDVSDVYAQRYSSIVPVELMHWTIE